MKRILFAALLLTPILFSSCKSGGSGDPKAVLSQFFDALKNKDIAAAKKLATEDSKQMLDLMEMGLKAQPNAKDDGEFDKAKMEFGEPKIEGDKATVSVKKAGSDDAMNFTLKKEKGDWKVAFDKATIMGSAMDKMKEQGMNPADSIGKAMEELKNVNMDSLKDKMHEGMEKLDSVTKELKKAENK